jgi:DNA-binding transcriptional regulator YiaG
MANDAERLAKIRSMCRSGEARRRRLAAELSLSEVADSCGVQVATVHRWETGGRRPRREAGLRYLEVLESIARAVTR